MSNCSPCIMESKSYIQRDDDDDVHFVLDQHVYLDFKIESLWLDMLLHNVDSEPKVFAPYYWWLAGKQAISILVFGWHTIYHTWCKHASHYTSDQYAHRFFHLGVHVPFYLHFWGCNVLSNSSFGGTKKMNCIF
jgi:hypothetical protein